MLRRFAVTAVFLAITQSLSACAGSLTYVAEPLTAKVVDAESGQPLAGVVVVAHWELERGTVGGNVPAGQLKVMEAVTGKGGKFSFPGFGPETVRDSFLVDKDPELIIFKSGYKYRRLLNEYSSDKELRTRRERRSDWSGKAIKLQQFKGSQNEYARHLSFLMTALRFIEDNCNWKKTPKMVLELQEQSEVFKASGILRTFYSVDYLPTNVEICGSPKEFFRDIGR